MRDKLTAELLQAVHGQPIAILKELVDYAESIRIGDDEEDVAFCGMCNNRMVLIRPGKHECEVCAKIEQHVRERVEAEGHWGCQN